MIDCVVAMSRLETDVRLGDYDEFSWFSTPRSRGSQDGSWRAWFGGKVVDGLCEVLDERLSRIPRKDGLRAAIGRVPYEATSFIAHVIMFSEPMDSVSQRPNPNLLHVDYDHAGMAEAMRDLEDSYMDSLADDEPVEDF
jgi:hypothetical protein